MLVGTYIKRGVFWDEIKAANESFLGKLQDLSGTNIGEDDQAEKNIEDYFVLNYEYFGEE